MSDQEQEQVLTSHCFHCNERKPIINVEKVKTANNRLRISANCGECGRKISRFIQDPENPPKEKKPKKTADKETSVEMVKVKSKKRRHLKLCSNCSCANHQEAIAVQRPLKRKKTRTEKLEEQVDAYARTIEELLTTKNQLKQLQTILSSEPASQPTREDSGSDSERE